jgi:hypothetical protein
MSKTANVSVRMSSDIVERIRIRAEARGERLSDVLRRYAEEGDRAETHPGVVFRPGPTGRRAALAGGPDVWEVVAAVRAAGGPPAVERLASELSLTVDRIGVALRYAADYPDEVEARIALHQRESAHYDALVGG